MYKALTPLVILTGFTLVACVVAYNGQQANAKARATYLASMGPHNPDHYQFPVCVSRDNPGWGVIRGFDYRWYVQRPDRDGVTEIHGHWRQYDKLTNLACREG